MRLISGACDEQRAFELFEEPRALEKRKHGIEGYRPEWTETLAGEVKKSLQASKPARRRWRL